MSYIVNFRGYPACPCLAEWLPVYEAELQRRSILNGPLHIYQLIGGAAASAGTHSSGGAFDLLNLPGDEDIWVGRQMGAAAYWTRPYNWDGRGGMEHNHGVLTGCPHNGPARYQIAAVYAGQNGLASHGPDTGPRPIPARTWKQGIAWAKAQEDYLMTDDASDKLDKIIAQGDAAKKRDVALRNNVIKPLAQMIVDLAEAANDAATKAQVKRQADRILNSLDTPEDAA